MIRFASFLALACLTVAATVLLTASEAEADDLSERLPKRPELPNNRFPFLALGRTAPFHARFSLN